MISSETKQKLKAAETLEEVKELLKDEPGLDPVRVYEEVNKHRSLDAEKLDLEELDAIAGGADRDWVKDGCASTVEVGSWCWSNDHCVFFDVTYDNLWATCPDGHPHEFKDGVCVRCGINAGTAVNPG